VRAPTNDVHGHSNCTVKRGWSFSGGIFRSQGTALSSAVKEELLCTFFVSNLLHSIYFRYVLRDLKIQRQLFIEFLLKTCVTENIG